jgi:hypothetical protein
MNPGQWGHAGRFIKPAEEIVSLLLEFAGGQWRITGSLLKKGSAHARLQSPAS